MAGVWQIGMLIDRYSPVPTVLGMQVLRVGFLREPAEALALRTSALFSMLRWGGDDVNSIHVSAQ